MSDSISCINFLDNHKIPYVFINIKIDKEKDTKKVLGIPNGWMKWTYDECMEFNLKKLNKNGININLSNSKFMIIDIDNKDKKDEYLKEYGSEFMSKSTRKQLPHLWRLKHIEDKNTTKTNYKDGLDFIYKNVFEFKNSIIENVKENIPIFDKYPKEDIKTFIKDVKKVNKKIEKVEKEKKEESIKKDFKIKKSKTEIHKYLNLIPNNEKITYDDWFKIVCSLKNDNIENYNNVLEWSKTSNRHTDEHFNHVWNYCESRNTIGTLLYYSKKYNEKGYFQLQSNFSNNEDNLSKIFLKIHSENIVYSNECIYIYYKNNWLKDDSKNNKLKKTIRIILLEYFYDIEKHYKKLQVDALRDLNNDEESNIENGVKQGKVYENIIKITKKISSKSGIENICTFVLQDLSFDDTNIVFDIGKEQHLNLHFKNGCYQLDKKKFRNRLKTDYITKYLDWNYIKGDIDKKIINDVDDFYKKLQPNEKEREFCLNWLAYNLCGKTSKMKFKMNIGYTASNGKSTEFGIHDKVFDIYSKKLDNSTFNLNNDKKHKQLIHLVQNPIRFSYIEELKTERLDADCIKDFVDAKNINVEIMYGTSTTQSIQAKLSTCSNKDFNIDVDEGVLRRGLVQFYKSEFKDIYKKDDYKNNKYKKILDYSDRFDNELYKNAYLRLLINRFDTDFKIPSSNANLFKQICNEYDLIGNVLNTEFNITKDNKDMVNKDDMMNILKIKLDNNKLTWREVLSSLKTKGLKYDKDKKINRVRGCFIGITMRNNNNIENDEE
jgi:hypothetical protein